MAEDEDKAPEAKDASAGKSNKGLVVVVLIAAVVLGGGAAAAGAIVAMRMAPSANAAPAPAASEDKVLGTVDFASLVVDLRSADGASHHLRVSLSAEVPSGGAKEAKDELESLMPRGREAAIGYLRALSYEDATDPHGFEKVRGELAKKIIEAIGEKHVAGILITDYVAQ